MTTLVDKGASAPKDFAKSIEIPVPLFPARKKIAEFGIQVNTGELLNFVKLRATVGFAPGPSAVKSVDAVIFIDRQLAYDPLSSELTIHTAQQTIDIKENSVLITTIHTETGDDFQVPNGYYSYSLYISHTGPNSSDGPVVIGPISFSGSSYCKNS